MASTARRPCLVLLFVALWGCGAEPAVIARVEVIPARAVIAAGASLDFFAVAYDAAGDRVDGGLCGWDATPGAVVGVNWIGEAQGFNPGLAEIVADCGGVRGRAALTVEPD